MALLSGEPKRGLCVKEKLKVTFPDIEKRILVDSVVLVTALLLLAIAWPYAVAVAVADTASAFLTALV